VPLVGQFRQPLKIKILRRLQTIEPSHLVYALLAAAVPFLLTLLLQATLPPALFRINEQNIGILFIIACAFVAGRYGLIPGLLTAITSFLVNNYFFSLPYYSLKLSSVTDLFSMGLFLSAALLIALFTSQMREYMQKISKRELLTEMLFMLYRLTSESYTRQQAIETLQQNLERMLDVDIAFFMPSLMSRKMVEPVCPAGLELQEEDRKALVMCWSDMKSTGAASPYNPGTAWRFEPMIFTSGEVGVLGARTHHPSQLDAWFGGLLSATADQTAAILMHIELERSMEATRISEEREKLRSMLLSSISHDFKTPLTGIIGSLSAHQTLRERMKPEKRHELIEGSLEEARRLDRFITNILDMTRLETGNIRFKEEWYQLKHLMENMISALQHRPNKRELKIDLPNQEVEVLMDIIMTGQVLQNLIDNAYKYTPSGTAIEISWTVEDGKGALCEVRDHGPGIPPENLEHVFDKYARLNRKDSQTAGTGLGLAIAKAIIEAQGGWINVQNHHEGGAVFSFYLPRWRCVSNRQPKEIAYAAHK